MSDQDRTPEQDEDLSEEQLDDVSGGFGPLPPVSISDPKPASAPGGTPFGGLQPGPKPPDPNPGPVSPHPTQPVNA